MDSSLNDSAVDLRKYWGVLKVRKWSIVTVSFLVLAAAMGFSFLQTPTYQAEARVLIQPLAGAQGTGIQPVDVQTESEVIGSQPVAQLVQGDIGSHSSLDSLLEGLTVKGSTGTQTLYSSNQVMILTYTSTSPEFASKAVNSFADNYIQYRKEQALETFVTARQDVQKRIDSATEQLNEVTQQLEKASDAGDAALTSTLETQRSVLIARLGVLQQRLDDLQPDEAVRSGGAQVIEAASPPTSPSSPDFVKNGILAVLVGIALGIAYAVLRERLDDRFKGRSDLEQQLNCPVLATVPKFASGSKKQRYVLVAADDSKGLASEAYRGLRTNLEYILAQQGVKSVVVTSPSEGEGKTTTAANLGTVLAQAGRRVILVSADLRRPSLANYFGVKARDGLSTLLTGDREFWHFLQDPGIPNLRILPSGPVPDNPAELLTSVRLADLVRQLEQNADVVLIDSPPVLAVADSSILAARAGVSILVIDAAGTARSAAVHAKEELERSGGRVVGTVLNSFDPTSSPYYYAPYYYSSGYQSEGDAAPKNGGKSLTTDPAELSRSRFDPN